VLFRRDRDGCPGDVFVHEEGGYTCTAQAIRLMMRCGAIMSGSGDGVMGEIFEVHWMKRGRHGPQDDQDFGRED
jgi:hypothetical protein